MLFQKRKWSFSVSVLKQCHFASRRDMGQLCMCPLHTHHYLCISFHSCALSHTDQVSFPKPPQTTGDFSVLLWEAFFNGKREQAFFIYFIFFTPKLHSQSVLKLSLGYRSSYITQTVLPVNEMSLSFYTEIILKLRCKILHKNDVFESAHTFKRERWESHFYVFHHLTKLLTSGRKIRRSTPFIWTLKAIQT